MKIVNSTITDDSNNVTHVLLFVNKNECSGGFIHLKDVKLFNETEITEKMVRNLPFNYLNRLADVANGKMNPLELKHQILRANGIHLKPLKYDFVIF
ncbi:MAG: hypothetical protein ACOCWW_01840 [Bacteroidota bacterium]